MVHRCAGLITAIQEAWIFPAADLMAVVEMGTLAGKPPARRASDKANRGVGELFTTNAFTSIAFT